ncbi:iron complex outermembrane receptor protein [Chitinivorax tropicus]|uniref:Iron complex outermembrane receptor protein n=1 Tax=Chitinivorax tropicus TaxID=714531 RepID=A0A840MIY5_9PROT|nr:TonB-dependent receptor [Chitinivorax tropicus]MBB5019164.1 iron complex outermembrane receptor protein [Chitinivorax tropicus]
MRLKPITMALATAGVVSILSPVHAEEQPKKTERIEVTGSHIKRISAESATPIQVVKREEIAKTGATNVKELLDTLSMSTSSSDMADIGRSNSFATGSSSVSFRNMGQQSTLVLLNFRRVAPYALADYADVFTNLDALPLDAIERVEVLKSGASAIYGSDAVAGVINIITRKDYRGLQIKADHSWSHTSGTFKSNNASITGGMGDLAADRYNVLVNADFYKRDPVMWNDVMKYSNREVTKKFRNFGSPSSYSYPGNVNLKALPGCAEKNSGGLCIYNRYERFQAVPESKRANFFAAGKLQLTDSLLSFTELTYSKIKTEYLNAFQAYGPALPPTDWGDPVTSKPKTFTYRGLPVGHPLNSTNKEVGFHYRFKDGPANSKVDSDSYRLVTGLKGSFGEQDWETAVGIMGAKTVNREYGSFSESGFKKVIGDYTQTVLPADFFNKPNGYRMAQENSAEVLSVLFPEYGYKGENKQSFIDGKISGPIAELPTGTLGYAAGFDLRKETFTITPTENTKNGDVVGLGQTETNASRSLGAVFGELSIPVMKNLEAQVAGRLDKAKGFDAHFSPKVGFRFEPSKSMLFRGTFETGFRAPNLTESAPSTKIAFNNGQSDPKRCPQAERLSEDLQAQASALPTNDPRIAFLQARADTVRQNECSAGVVSIVKNNPNLKPEISKSFSLGMVLEPIAGISTSVDYWNIQRKDEIGLRTIADLLANEDTLEPGIINRNSLANETNFTPAELAQYGVTVGSLASRNQAFENRNKTKTDGIDFNLRGSFSAGAAGKIQLDWNTTYLHSYYEWSANKGGYGDNLSGRYGYSKYSSDLTTSLVSKGATNGLRFNFNSGTTLKRDYNDTQYTDEACATRGWNTSECRIASYMTVDYFLNYSAIKNLTINFNVRNVFNRKPEPNLRWMDEKGGIIPQDINDARGRMLKLGFEYKFL